MLRRLSCLFPFLLAACGNPYYQGPITDHFNGKTFYNPGRPQTNGFTDFLRWQFGFGPADALPRASWPTQVPPVTPPAVPAARVSGTALTVTAVGHATYLLQTQNLNILTDPVWSDRASPVSWAGPKRVTPPGIAMESLPPINLILISHNHYDHLDIPTLKALVAKHNPLIITPLGNDTIIHRHIPTARITTLDWQQHVLITPTLTVHALPMQHWSARSMNDRRAALWAAFVLKAPQGSVYFVGDSGYGEGEHAGTWFREASQQFGGFRLAILPIGAYEPRWFMRYSHMNPAEAVAAKHDSQSRYAIGHHFGTFQLTNEGHEAPTAALAAALAAAKIPPEDFRALLPGQVWHIPTR